MTYKYIEGYYPDGYTLNANYAGVIIGASAKITGAGLICADPAFVSNAGTVTVRTYGTGACGISLPSGGTIINGSASSNVGLISSYYKNTPAVRAPGALIENYGTIIGSVFTNSGYERGNIINEAASAHVGLIVGYCTAQNITNLGLMELTGGVLDPFVDEVTSIYGTITNGSETNGMASLYGGVSYAYNGNIVNYGTMTGASIYAIVPGKDIVNGSVSDQTAFMGSGKVNERNKELPAYACIARGGNIANFGTIIERDAVYSIGAYVVGGTITNGSASVTSALIEGRYGVELGNAGTIINYGTIEGVSYGGFYYGNSVKLNSPGDAVVLEPGSRLVGAVGGFVYNDVLDFRGVNTPSVSFYNNVLTINNAGTVVNEITLSGNFENCRFDLTPDGVGGTDVTLRPSGPTLLELSDIAALSYTNADDLFRIPVDDYEFINYDYQFANNNLNENNYFSDYYVDKSTKQIVVAFRGTNKWNVTNLLADKSFLDGAPTLEFWSDVKESAEFLISIETNTAYKGYSITLTGHSLGGAIAQILGLATGLPTVGFDAPGGGGALYTAVTPLLANLIGTAQPDAGPNLDVSLAGDQVSYAGVAIGSAMTLATDLPIDTNNKLLVALASILSHSPSNIVTQLSNNVVPTEGRTYADAVPDMLADLGAVGQLGPFIKGVAVAQALLAVAADVSAFFYASPNGDIPKPNPGVNTPLDPDAMTSPVATNEYALVGKSGSPDMASAALPELDGVAAFEISERVNGTWSSFTAEQPGTVIQFASSTSGFRFYGEDASGNAISLPIGDNFYIQVSFATSGAFAGTFSEALGTVDWAAGNGDWGTGSDWSTGGTPGPGTNVIIQAPGKYTVTITGPAEETLITVNHAGATVVDAATLTVDDLLEVDAGVFELASGGVVSDGTMVAAGSGLFVWSSGTLDDVTYEGTLSLAAKGAAVSVDQQLLATGATGSGPGNIVLTGQHSELSFIGEQTLDNATLSIGSVSNTAVATLYSADPQATGAVLTLGPNLIIQQSGAYATIGGSAATAGNGVVNDGTIDAGFNGGRLTISSLNFTNSGLITVSNGDALRLQPGNLLNLTKHILTGGSYDVDAASILELNQNASIVTDDATIVLSGAGSTIESLDTVSGSEVAIDATLQAIGTDGKLELLAGRGWTSVLNLSNAGTLDIAGGAVAPASVANMGLVSGYGLVSADVSNSGSILAAGGTLEFAQAMTGLGTMTIGAGAVLELDGAAASTLSLAFAGANGTLALKEASQFSAAVSDFVSGDTIDLVATTATQARLGPGDTLVITNGAQAVATLQLTGNYSGATFKTNSDNKGGTDITVGAIRLAGSQASQRFIDVMAGFGGGAALEFGRWGSDYYSTYRSVLATPTRVQMA